jgi:pimeloyl-ACP methyl ester carboxylesterase
VATGRFVDVRGIRHHYLESGDPAADAAVLIHGLTQTAHSFDEIAPVLAQTYRVIAYDVRGRGDSGWGPPDEYTQPQYVADLQELLRALDVERCSLVGTSMGGIISMLAAGTGLVRPERLVLNDVGPEVGAMGLQRIASYIGEAPDSFPTLEAATEWFCASYPSIARLPFDEAREAVRIMVKQAEGAWTFKYDPAIRQQFRSGAPAGAAPTLWEQWEKIACPTLVVRGEESDILTRDVAQRMGQTGPRAEVVEVPGAGHAPTLGEPEAVAAISRFFAL